MKLSKFTTLEEMEENIYQVFFKDEPCKIFLIGDIDKLLQYNLEGVEYMIKCFTSKDKNYISVKKVIEKIEELKQRASDSFSLPEQSIVRRMFEK